jgi:hypothetical protein
MGETLDDLILQFRSRDVDKSMSERAALTLVSKFQNLTRKYLHLMTTGSFKPKDGLVVVFLTLCSSVLGTKNPTATATVLKSALRKYNRDELEHVCNVAVLTTAAARTNIAMNYHYQLWQLVQPMLDDCVPLTEDIADAEVVDNVPIDEDWVRGLTCGEMFAQMTPEDRRIIRLLWHQQLPESQVRSMLGLTATMLNDKKHAIHKQLWKFKS